MEEMPDTKHCRRCQVALATDNGENHWGKISGSEFLRTNELQWAIMCEALMGAIVFGFRKHDCGDLLAAHPSGQVARRVGTSTTLAHDLPLWRCLWGGLKQLRWSGNEARGSGGRCVATGMIAEIDSPLDALGNIGRKRKGKKRSQ